ncbi:DNA polymerase delta subunit 4-like [Liolophura sinensis]|uniref:DNA polymerase delta subunit 4-like n=1 Tax=Liolophura sinensis TaxID=3198878 RepID=UPI0031590955
MSKLLTDTYKQVKKSNRSTNDANVKIQSDARNVAPSTSKKAVSDDLDKLKQFDLNWEFGPCAGITRMERWQRAQKHGLNPPESVRDLITLHPNDERYTKSLWNDYDL